MQPSSLSPIFSSISFQSKLVCGWNNQLLYNWPFLPLLWNSSTFLNLQTNDLKRVKIVALSVLAFTWWQHRRAGSKYRAVRAGTSGCSHCPGDYHYKRKGARLFSTVRVLLCQASKRDSLSCLTHCSPLQ